jgi:hypothetical protein
LRVASIPPPAGPLAATICPYVELRRSLGLKGDAIRNTLLDLDRFAQARRITSPAGITSAVIEQWMQPMDVIAAVRELMHLGPNDPTPQPPAAAPKPEKDDEPKATEAAR